MTDTARFRAGDPATIACVSRLVSLVVHTREFFIPAGDRGEVIQEAMVHLWDAVAGSLSFPADIGGAEGRDLGLDRAVAGVRRLRTPPRW